MDVELLNKVEADQISSRQPLPDRYLGLDDQEMADRIKQARDLLGRQLLILSLIHI